MKILNLIDIKTEPLNGFNGSDTNCKTREDHNDINRNLVRARKSNTRRFKM
ncbi:hypothetical protein Hanom_Chr05g00452201 [Helianthus anomalus]